MAVSALIIKVITEVFNRTSLHTSIVVISL